MTPTQRTLITELIITELEKLTAAALAAGADPDGVTAELERRLRKMGRGQPGNGPGQPRE